MCGRYTLTVDADTLKTYFQLEDLDFDYRPRYNIAPGQEVPVVFHNSRQRRIALMRWGLIPNWAKDKVIGYKTINARAETVAQKPAFRESFYRRRCLIPADGFYEWAKRGKEKIPLRIIVPGQPLFAFAGIWDCWCSPEGESIFSFSIITTAANDFMQPIHSRMPLILAGKEEQRAWLTPTDPGAVRNLLQPYRGPMRAYRVSPIVNSPKLDTPLCIKEMVEEDR